jgi:hypothetical protein
MYPIFMESFDVGVISAPPGYSGPRTAQREPSESVL